MNFARALNENIYGNFQQSVPSRSHLMERADANVQAEADQDVCIVYLTNPRSAGNACFHLLVPGKIVVFMLTVDEVIMKKTVEEDAVTIFSALSEKTNY